MVFKYTSDSPDTSVRSVYRSLETYGESFHWLEAGRDNDETLILLHGLLASGFAFRKVIEPLAERFRVVVPDMPGHGRDATFRSGAVEPEIDDLIDWFQKLLRTVVDDEPYHLVGHSLGALLCFIAGREYERFQPIQRIGLVSPGVRIGLPQWTSRIFEMLPSSLARFGTTRLGFRLYEPIQWRQTRMNGDETRKYLAPLQDSERLEFILNLGADLLREPDRLPGAHRVDVPTLIVSGKKDHFLPEETVRLLGAVIPDARLEMLEGVGHCPMEDSPAEFVRLVKGFLSDSAPNSPRSDLPQE